MQQKIFKENKKVDKTSNSHTNIKVEASHPMFYDPKKYKITAEKTYFNLKWHLLVLRKDDYKNLTYNEAFWVMDNSIREDVYEKVKDHSFDQTVGK